MWGSLQNRAGDMYEGSFVNGKKEGEGHLNNIFK